MLSAYSLYVKSELVLMFLKSLDRLLCVTFLLCHAFKPFHHAEHDAHRDEADDEEYCPANPDWPCIIHKRANEDKEIADGCSTEPKTLAQTNHVTWSNL